MWTSRWYFATGSGGSDTATETFPIFVVVGEEAQTYAPFFASGVTGTEGLVVAPIFVRVSDGIPIGILHDVYVTTAVTHDVTITDQVSHNVVVTSEINECVQVRK